MIQKLKMLMLSMSTLIFFAAPLAVAGVANAADSNAITQTNINGGLCAGSKGDFTNLDSPNGGQGCADNNGQTANDLVKTVINVLSILVGVVAVIMLIIGGFRYVTSGGKQESVTGAKNTILYAIIGLVVVALAQLVVHFVLNNLNTATTS